MAKITIIYDELGVTTTFEKELPETPALEDIFTAYLEANERFTFINDVSVSILGHYDGEVEINWDNDQGITQRTLPSSEIEYELWTQISHFKSDDTSGYIAFGELTDEQWYMGHVY